MSQLDIAAFFDGYWKVVCAKIRRPLSGVLLPDALVVAGARSVFDDFLRTFSELPARGEIGSFLTGRARQRSLELVAEARAESGDPDLYRDPDEPQFYEHNLHLERLQQRTADNRYESPEWGELPPVLKGRALAVLRRCGVPEDACEDVFVDCLAVLATVRVKDGTAPIDQLTIFEEVVPLFTTMVHNRGVSWLRKQSAQKNRPNNPAFGESLDDPDRFIAPASQAAGGDPFEGLTFERMHASCSDCLSELEWHILTALFVEANVTRGELSDDPEVMRMMGVKASSSLGNRRRHLNKHLESALDKLGNCLKTRDL